MMNVVYWAERSYGKPGVIEHRSDPVVNVHTGEQQVTTVQYTIERLVPLSFTLSRVFESKMQTVFGPYGNLYDTDSTSFLVNKKKLPVDYIITAGDHVLFQDRIYAIKSMVDYDWDRVKCVVLVTQEVSLRDEGQGVVR